MFVIKLSKNEFKKFSCATYKEVSIYKEYHRGISALTSYGSVLMIFSISINLSLAIRVGWVYME
jgi:hypothetical protein